MRHDRRTMLTGMLLAAVVAPVVATAQDLHPSRRPSPLGISRITLGDTYVRVIYGRPYKRGRNNIFGTKESGALVPFGERWRTGANEATEITVTGPVLVAGRPLAAGTYSLWIQHTRTGTFLVVNRQTGQWGTQYDPAQDLARIPMQLSPAPSHVEELTVAVRSQGANRGSIEFAWGDRIASAAFTASAPR